MKSSILTGFLSFVLVTSGRGAVPGLEKPALPDGPLLAKVKSFSTWKTTFAYPDDKKSDDNATPPAPRSNPTGFVLKSVPRSVTLTRTGTLWKAETVDVTGETMEQCFDGQTQVVDSPKLPSPTLVPEVVGSDVKFVTDFQKQDFPDMEWISPATYLGVQKIGSAPCLVFSKDEMAVWVNIDTRMPVVWRRGGETRYFQELSPPSTPLVFSPRVAKVSAALQRAHDALKRKPPRGG